MSTTREREALAAADAIIDDFAHHRRDAYFAGFAPDATFLFHTTPNRLDGRAAYETLWDDWERTAGFRVHGCVSTNRRIQLFGPVAVFSHDVATRLEMHGRVDTVLERESIILERRAGAWLCVHEHLSTLTPEPVRS